MTPDDRKRWFMLADSMMIGIIGEQVPRTDRMERIGKRIEDAILKAVAEERDACAMIAEKIEDSMAEAIAERIRERGKS